MKRKGGCTVKFLLRLTEEWTEDSSEEDMTDRTCIHVRNELFDTTDQMAGRVQEVIRNVTEQNELHDAHHISRCVFNVEISMIIEDDPIEEESPVAIEAGGDVNVLENVSNVGIISQGRRSVDVKVGDAW